MFNSKCGKCVFDKQEDGFLELRPVDFSQGRILELALFRVAGCRLLVGEEEGEEEKDEEEEPWGRGLFRMVYFVGEGLEHKVFDFHHFKKDSAR